MEASIRSFCLLCIQTSANLQCQVHFVFRPRFHIHLRPCHFVTQSHRETNRFLHTHTPH